MHGEKTASWKSYFKYNGKLTKGSTILTLPCTLRTAKKPSCIFSSFRANVDISVSHPSTFSEGKGSAQFTK